MAHIIQARLEEIIEHIYYEIKNSSYEHQLIAGIVLTGGGAQMKHIAQLFEYVTGLDTRIGFPNEHLAKGNSEEITSPMYATGVGLVIKGFHKIDKQEEFENTDNHEEEKVKKQGLFGKLAKVAGDFFDEDEGA